MNRRLTVLFFNIRFFFLFVLQDMIVMIWNCTMSAVEWNKKEDLVQEQALRHLRQYVPLFVAFSSNVKSELALINKIQARFFEYFPDLSELVAVELGDNATACQLYRNTISTT